MSTTPIIGQSAVMKKVIKTAERIAKSANLTILIVGENGTGKELIARLVHELSSSSDQPFVDINCGAIPESLLESELFGYEKGAFTGAQRSKAGLFELAHGGTVFLDEISNTSLSFQGKLLKAVETKRFRRLGGVKEISIATRIIAATNIDLLKAVKEKTFREDLYYRLNIGQILIPPLRERSEDIEILANHFFEMSNKEYRQDIKGFKPEAMNAIKNYSWPGNIRQLKNVIDRAVLIDSEEWIELDDLNLDNKNQNSSSTNPIAKSKTISKEIFNQFRFPTKGLPLEDIERKIILSALQKAGGNLSHAARLLKISRGKLRYRMEKLEI